MPANFKLPPEINGAMLNYTAGKYFLSLLSKDANQLKIHISFTSGALRYTTSFDGNLFFIALTIRHPKPMLFIRLGIKEDKKQLYHDNSAGIKQ